MICCVTGHRPKEFPFRYEEDSHEYIMYRFKLRKELEKLITSGYTTFISGMANGADLDFAEDVLLYRNEGHNISLEAALPYPIKFSKKDSEYADRLYYVLSNCNSKNTVSPYYHKGCMQNRNRYMVDRSDLILAIWNGHCSGGTWNTIEYARKKKKEIRYIMLDKI